MRLTPRRPSFYRFRQQLADTDAIPQLVLLGLLTGLFTALVTTGFRELITFFTSLYLPTPDYDDFAALEWPLRLLLPLIGVAAIVTLFRLLHDPKHRLGIAHVIERLSLHQGRLPLKPFLLQFFAGVAAIASGHSIGREGPAVHLGAASGSLLGQWLHLPNNSLRVLVACGSAAAISSVFNTPIAGIVFAMEVVVMEYTVAGFIPVMLASVIAAVITRSLYGTEPAFHVPSLTVTTVNELPLIIITGITMGLLAVCFCRLIILFARTNPYPLWLRLTCAALLTGLTAIWLPQVMGIGYGTLSDIMFNNLGFTFLCLLTIGKLCTSAASVGLGVPGGLIGPSLFIGAAAGSTVGSLTNMLGLSATVSGFPAMVGMSAMLGAVLQAPLTALITVLELTRNPGILLPSLIAIIIAWLITSQLFRQQSIFTQMLSADGLDFRHDPVAQALRRAGVASVMSRSLQQLERHCPFEQLHNALKTKPRWLLINNNGKPQSLMPAVELARQLEQLTFDAHYTLVETADLLGIPAKRLEVGAIDIKSTLHEALRRMDQNSLNALYVVSRDRRNGDVITGIITRADIEAWYQVPH
ncbi:chloride channel protein [Kistimonas scapharcae]|uniref:Chloride channel protein n=1 Tax=Kistimonas scapharcae TaxID=1036133 RepID=A0ABP8V3V8_9GAMM